VLKWLALIIIIIGAVFSLTRLVYAQAVADPDTLTIDNIFAYDSVLEDDDLLVVVVYNVAYATLPTLGINQTFICRFLADSAEQNASEIIPFNNLGYGLGVCSFYWTASQKVTSSIEYDNPNSETYEVVVQGKPSAFASPPRVTNQNIQWRDANDTVNLLTADIIAIATTLETDAAWVANGFTLLDFITGLTVLTRNGESYFGRAIPNLAAMVPDIFGSSVTQPFIDEREFTFSERDRLGGFWVGTGLETAFQAGADMFNVPQSYFTAFIGLFLISIVAGLGIMITQSAEFGLMTAAVTVPLVGVIGLLSLTFVVVVGALCILALGFALFLRRAG
jgi:hypothetical protein